MTLRAVDEDRDGEQVVADRALATAENRAARNRKLLVASLALPRPARGDRVHDQTAAARAIGLPPLSDQRISQNFACASSSDSRAT